MATSRSLLDKVLESAGGKAEFERKHRQYSKSLTYLDEAMDELVKYHNNQWVAVYESTIVGYASDYGKLAEEIERKGIPIEEVVIKFLTNRKIMTLF